MVRFTEGKEVSVVPMKRVTDPIPLDVKESSLCSVRWSDKRIYSSNIPFYNRATVSAI